MKKEILKTLNNIIVEEKGNPVGIEDMFTDSNLDSLGTILTLATLDSVYPIFKYMPEEVDAINALDIPNLTIRALIKQCVLSITSTSQAVSSEMGT